MHGFQRIFSHIIQGAAGASSAAAGVPTRRRDWSAILRPAIAFLALTALFGVAYTQSPLYTSNQNQYFLHAAARAGIGDLRSDWLANTLDPTPVFTALVAATYRWLPWEGVFYLYYALLMGVYAALLLRLAAVTWGLPNPADFSFLKGGPVAAAGWLLLALFVLIHSAGLRFGLSRTLGVNWTYVLEDGVADQRLLGSVFQPSAFGVLLIVSIDLYERRKLFLAVLAAALAATFHPTYLLAAALLTLAYLLAELGLPRLSLPRLKTALAAGALALAAVLPILLYVWVNFGSTPAETTAQARDLLVNVRIPHHALPSWWFDATAVFKLGLVLAAIYAARRTRLLPALLVPFVIVVLLTLLQVATGSAALALVFPWRPSTFLVPLAASLLLGRLVAWLAGRPAFSRPRVGRLVTGLSLAALALAVAVGAIRLKLDFARKAAAPERPLMAYVAGQRAPGEVYLTPVKMQDFRLATGAAVYVEFKSIPYRDEDVLEWRRRLLLADHFYITADCTVLAGLAAEGVSRVVLPHDSPAGACAGLRPLYADASYGLYALAAR